MNQCVMQRETATNPAFARRETREQNPKVCYHNLSDHNPWSRIIFAGTASNMFQVLRRRFARGKPQLIPYGSFPTLDDALAARDTLPLDIDPLPAIVPQEPAHRLQWWEE